jgi:hypothetical protein
MRDRGWKFRMRARLPWLVALACLCGGSLLAIPGHAGAEQSEEEKCQGELLLYEFLAYGVGTTLAPASGAEVVQHSAVTFTGESASTEPEPGKREEIPLSFQVSTSKTRDAEKREVPAPPYLASGVGTASPNPGSGTVPYSFTTSKATENPGTVYWQASFSRRLPHCNGGKGETKTFPTSILGAKPHALTVLKGEEEPERLPPCHPPTPICISESPETPGKLKVSITAAQLVHIGHPAVAYLVGCTVKCTGKTSFQAWQLRGRHKALRVRALDFGPRSVSITAAAGGNERFTAHWRGRALKTLRSMLRGGHEVKLVVTAKVVDPEHNPTQVSRVILLKR